MANPDQIYIFTESMLNKALMDTVEMFIEYRDKHAHTDQAARSAAVYEILQGIELEREMAIDDPEYIATNQIIPVISEDVFCEEDPCLSN